MKAEAPSTMFYGNSNTLNIMEDRYLSHKTALEASFQTKTFIEKNMNEDNRSLKRCIPCASCEQGLPPPKALKFEPGEIIPGSPPNEVKNKLQENQHKGKNDFLSLSLASYFENFNIEVITYGEQNVVVYDKSQ